MALMNAQVNRALKQKGIKIEIHCQEMWFDNENKWDGFICDDHKETHKKIPTKHS